MDDRLERDAITLGDVVEATRHVALVVVGDLECRHDAMHLLIPDYRLSLMLQGSSFWIAQSTAQRFTGGAAEAPKPSKAV